MTKLFLTPIGTLHTPWHTLGDCPRNGRQPDPAPVCTAKVLPEFLAGLQSLDGFSHLILIYWLNQPHSIRLLFTPPFDPQPHGVFASRAPWRPNPIGLSVVTLDGFDFSGRAESALSRLPRWHAFARHQALSVNHGQ